MKNQLTALLLFSIVTFTSCSFFENCIEPEGEIVMNELDLADLHSLVISSGVNVTLTQGPTQQIEINGPQNYIDALNKEITNGKWDISFNQCVSQAEQVEIFISITKLRELTVDGSGNVLSEGVIAGEDLSLTINGSGNIQLELEYKTVEAEVQGSGDIQLAGATKSLDIDINGSGDVEAINLLSDQTSIEINGSGDTRVNTTYSLDIEVNGSGDVYYKGEPRELNSTINGSGKLTQLK